MDDQAIRVDASAQPTGPVWLTYVELGERLRITPDAARQKAIRGRYRKQKGNDGKARVLVEPDVLLSAVQTQPGGDHTDDQVVVQMDAPRPVQTPDTPPSSGIDATLAAMLEEQIGFLRSLVEAERARADRLQDELLSLAKTHSTTLERYAEDMRQRAEQKAVLPLVEHRPWWKRLAG